MLGIAKHASNAVDEVVYTKLLAHFNDLSMPPTDERGGSYTIVDAGQSMTIVDPKFGYRCLDNNGGSGYFTPGPGMSFDYGDEDWCLEAFVRVAASPDDAASEICAVADEAAPQIWLMSYNYLAAGLNHGSSLFGAAAFEYTAPVWQHLAFYRLGDDVYTALDGVVFPHLGGGTSFGAGTANRLYIGKNNFWYNNLQGKLDELRYSVGTARYGAVNFTPPSAPFTLD